MRGQSLEYAFGRHSIPVADALERLRDRCFNGPLPRNIRSSSALREAQYGAPSIARIVGTSQESLSDESLKHTGERAGMHVQYGRQIAGRHARKQANYAQHQSLWTRHPNLSGHSLRDALQSVDNGPEQLHELQYIGEISLLPRFAGGTVRGRHITLSSNQVMLA
jgi:hypothetical protein